MSFNFTDFNNWHTLQFGSSYIGSSTEMARLLKLTKFEIENEIPIEKNLSKQFSFNDCNRLVFYDAVWENYTLSVFEKGEPLQKTLLVKDKDYLEIASEVENGKVLAFDFNCMRCNCRCEVFEIVGKNGYALQEDFFDLLYTVALEIAPNKLQEDCDCDGIKVLTGKTVGSISKSYKVFGEESLNIMANVKKTGSLLQHPLIFKYLSRYKYEMFQL